MRPDYVFEKGQAYIGTSTLDRHRQKIFVVTARRGDTVSFSHVRRVIRERVDDCDGTEIVKLKDQDGFDYFASARVPVDIDEAFRIVGLCK